MFTKIADWDRRVVWRFYNIQNVHATRFLKIVSHVGSTPFWVIVGLAAFIPGFTFSYLVPAYADWGAYLISFTTHLFTSFFVSGSVLIPIKYAVYRQRPYMKFVDIPSRDFHVVDPSFPSGHSAQWLFYGWVAATYLVGPWYFYLVIATLPLIMFSRIHLGSHFPSDTLVGAALGIGIIGLTMLFTPAFDAWYGWSYQLMQTVVHSLFG